MEREARIEVGVGDSSESAAGEAPPSDSVAAIFAKAGASVLLHELGGDVKWTELDEAPASQDFEVKALLGLTGSPRGSITYAFKRETALAIFATMSGLSTTGFDELAQSAIGELANMISGRGTTVLDTLGNHCDISPPILIIGKDVEIKTIANRHDYARIDTRHGAVYIDVGIDR